jgi:hypothetical protein
MAQKGSRRVKGVSRPIRPVGMLLPGLTKANHTFLLDWVGSPGIVVDDCRTGNDRLCSVAAIAAAAVAAAAVAAAAVSCSCTPLVVTIRLQLGVWSAAHSRQCCTRRIPPHLRPPPLTGQLLVSFNHCDSLISPTGLHPLFFFHLSDLLISFLSFIQPGA